MNIDPATASSGGSAAARRVPRPVHWLLTATIAAIGSALAFFQAPRPDPLSSPAPLSADWWRYPLERNAFKRLHALTAPLNGVFALRGTGEMWAVGNGGLLIRSDDGGGTWTQDSIVAALAEWPDVSYGAEQSPSKASLDSIYGNKEAPYAQSNAPVQKGPPIQQQLPEPPPAPTTSPPSSPRRLTDDFSDVYFVSPEVGWVVGSRGLVAGTQDGGATWTVQRILGAGDLVAIGFGTQGGLTIDRAGTVYRSETGAEWRRLNRFTLRGLSIARNPDAAFFVTTGGDVLSEVALDSAGSGKAGRFRQISFIDAQRGWGTDSAGRLWTTTNAASGWDTLPRQTSPLFGKFTFTDPNTGYAVSPAGHLLRTADGGREWTQILGRLRLYAAARADPDRAWAVGERGTLLVTDDGGSSWTTRRLPTEHDLVGIRFSGPDSGLVVDEAGGFWQTTDGGRTWVPDTVLPADELDSLGPRSVAVVSATQALASNGSSTYNREIGGPIWTEQVSRRINPFSRSSNSLLSLAGIDRRFSYAANPAGNLWWTENGGYGWEPVAHRLPRAPWAIFAADSLRLWTVGNDGAVLRSADGGATWIPDSLATRQRLRSVSFLGDSLGIGVSAAGTVLLSADAGRTWRDPARHGRSPAPWYGGVILLVVLLVLLLRTPRPVEPAPSVADLLVSDRPIRKGDRDPLGFTSVALGLSRFIRNDRTEPPLTIAITGKWGTGKSSLMNLLQDDLRQYGFRPIWFNAWHHQKEEHLLASLLHKVQAEAAPPFLHPGGMAFRARLLWLRARRFRTLAMVLAPVLVASVGYLASDFGEQPGRVLHGAVDLVGKLIPSGESDEAPAPAGDVHTKGEKGAEQGSLLAFVALLVSSIATMWKGFRTFGGVPATLMTTMRGAFRLRDLKAQTGFRSQFETEFQEVTDALGPRSMVILVDDLDRCHPKNVLEVLEAINFLVSSGRCFVLLGMDRNFVEGCVGLGFQDVAKELAGGERGTSDGRRPDAAQGDGAKTAEDREREIRRDFAVQYLEKLVNIEVPVPPATAVQLGELIASTGVDDDLAQRRRRRQRGLAWGARAAAAAVIVGVLGLVFTFAKRQGMEDLAEAKARTAPVERSLAAAPEPAGQPAPSGAAADLPTLVTASLAGDFVPGESAPTSTTLLALCLAAVLGGGLLAILRRPVVTVHDSESFTDALNTWSPLVYTRRNTPRAIKKFLNRVRFYAMRQEAHLPTLTQWDRVVAWMRRQPGLGAVVRWLLAEVEAPATAPAAASAPPAEEAIPEDVLVALSSIQECRADWLEKPELYENFSGFLKTNAVEALPASVQESLDSTRRWGPLTAYRDRFKRLSTGLRIG